MQLLVRRKHSAVSRENTDKVKGPSFGREDSNETHNDKQNDVRNILFLLVFAQAHAQTDPLPSWNDGAAKKAIIDFVQDDYGKGQREVRGAGGAHRRVRSGRHDVGRAADVHAGGLLPGAGPGGGQGEAGTRRTSSRSRPCSSGDREAMAKFTMPQLEMILAATLTGMTVDEFNGEVKKWLATAKHPRFKRPYTELTYQPMLEVMQLLRANGYKTYFVTGGGQDFVRAVLRAGVRHPARAGRRLGGRQRSSAMTRAASRS